MILQFVRVIVMLPRLVKAIAMMPQFARAIAMHLQVAKGNCDDSAGCKRDCDDNPFESNYDDDIIIMLYQSVLKDCFGLIENGYKNYLNDEEKKLLEIILKSSERLRNAYQLKEDFRQIYETDQEPEVAKVKLEEWLAKASKFYSQVITTIKNHFDGICNYFYNRTTSGKMEGIKALR